MSGESCQSCKFCKSSTDPASKQLQFYCAIKPPTAFPLQGPQGLRVMAIQPPLPQSNWCGDWKPDLQLNS